MGRLDDFYEEAWQFYRKPIKGFSRSLIRRYDKFLVDRGLLDSTSKLVIKTPSEIQLEKYPPKSTTNILSKPKKIAFIHEEVAHVSGGRYYSFFLISALLEMGHSVTVYTNRKPVYSEDFEKYKKPKFRIVASVGSQLVSAEAKADLYIGSPIHGAIAAIKLAKKYNKPAFTLVFDPVPMVRKYSNERGWTAFDKLAKMTKESDAKILSLCNETTKWICSWLNKRPEEVYPVYPCINSKVLDEKKRNFKRQKYAIFISRIVDRKRFEDTIKAIKKAGVKLKVITTLGGSSAQEIVKKHKATKLVDFHIGVDDATKFDMIRKSSVVINSSIFEGFGMYVAEAVATGTPFVGYDYPTFREIEEYSGAKNFYFAKPKDYKDLSKKLDKALEEKKIGKQSDMFDFERMVERLGNI